MPRSPAQTYYQSSPAYSPSYYPNQTYNAGQGYYPYPTYGSGPGYNYYPFNHAPPLGVSPLQVPWYWYK